MFPKCCVFQNQELVTAGQLQDKDDRQDMKNKICDLEEEVRTKSPDYDTRSQE